MFYSPFLFRFILFKLFTKKKIKTSLTRARTFLRILINILQGVGDQSNVAFDGFRPVLHVAQLLQSATEQFDDVQPLLRLLGEIRRARV